MWWRRRAGRPALCSNDSMDAVLVLELVASCNDGLAAGPNRSQPIGPTLTTGVAITSAMFPISVTSVGTSRELAANNHCATLLSASTAFWSKKVKRLSAPWYEWCTWVCCARARGRVRPEAPW